MKKILFFIACLLSVPFHGWTACIGSGATWTATPDYASVASCVSQVSEGGTVNVSSGSATWTTRLVINKGVELVGSGIDSTIITNNVGGTCEFSEACSAIIIHPTDYSVNHKIRISGFTLNSNGKRGIMMGYPMVAPFGLQTNVRIHHNKFVGPGISGGALFNYGTLYGVVDNNQIIGFYYPISHSGGGITARWWENSPQNIFALGSEYYMYFEDNTFNQNSAGSEVIISNAQYSSRLAFRYNTIINTALTYQLWEMHGYQGGVNDNNMDSCFGAEIYGNHVTHPSGQSLGFWKQRSGQARIFNNYYTGGPSQSYYVPYTGTSDYQCPTTDWLLKLTHNTYYWGNRKDYTGSLFYTYSGDTQTCHGVVDTPMPGRDVFSDSPTYESGYDIHISAGTLANIPATCVVGQGYWATNQSTTNLTGMVGAYPSTPISGTMYKCTATNTWTVDYVPYAYPHPLTLTGGDTTAPVVTIKLPVEFTDTYSTSSSTINISGTATDVVGVTSVTWSNSATGGSGTATCVTCDGTAGTKNWSIANIPLQLGVNTITISGRDAVPNTGTDILTVTYETTLPTISTPRTISVSGTTLTLPFSEAVTSALTGYGGFTISPSGSAATLSYASGSGTSTLVYTISRAIQYGETVTLSYTAPGAGLIVKDLAGNNLATITNISLTNSSTQGSGGDAILPTVSIVTPTDPYPTASATVNITGIAADNIGVTRVDWINNREGVTRTASCNGCPGNSITWSQNSIALFSGINIITTTAYDAAGNSITDTLTVTYTPVVIEPQTIRGLKLSGVTAN